jgi:hypothetical protein
MGTLLLGGKRCGEMLMLNFRCYFLLLVFVYGYSLLYVADVAQ